VRGKGAAASPRSFFQRVVERLGEELPRFLERAVAVRARAGRGGRALEVLRRMLAASPGRA